MNKTLTNLELKDENVIAELNRKFADKTIRFLNIRNNGSLIMVFNPADYNIHAVYVEYLSLFSINPYLHILLTNTEFSDIEIVEDE